MGSRGRFSLRAVCARDGAPDLLQTLHRVNFDARSLHGGATSLQALPKICEASGDLELSPVGSKIGNKERVITPTGNDCIEIPGARQNNLKGIDIDLPLGKLTVITGPSGSGKSSLAFQTIYAEGQRRYVETFSPYMRQFLDRMDKPRVDDIRGIPPAIAIEQSNPVKTSRSTVGTMTEINDYLKLLWPRIAHAFCPSCGREIRPENAQSITEQVLRDCVGKSILITFWVAVPSKTEPRTFFDFLQQQGYLRVWIDNKVVRVDDPNPKTKRLGARVQVVQDRIAITGENRTRLVEAIETALRFGKGQVKRNSCGGRGIACDLKDRDRQRHHYSCPVLDRLALCLVRFGHSSAHGRPFQF